MENLVRKTSLKEQKLAKAIVEMLEGGNSVSFKSGSKSVKVSAGLTKLLTQIFSMMKNGKSIAVMASEMEVSTQEAAEILSFSRPYVVKLLSQGKIPYQKAGTHRRIFLRDILVYKRALEKTRRRSLEALARQAQELRLGYE